MNDCGVTVEQFIKIAIIGCLLAIVASLGSGLFHMVSDKGQSKRMVRALTIRIVLSVVLFLLLFVAWSNGYIHPHGIAK
jgi:succinate dehydrogenase/fumarate reductase cytochrome b subunit